MVEVSNNFRLDIMHVHYAVPHATAALLAKNIASAQKMPFPNVVTTLHGTDITLLARDKNLMPVIKYSIENSCGVTSVSVSLKKDTVKALKTKKDITVIHNFYNPKKIRKSADSIRKALGVQNTDFLAIHLSNLRKVKRIPDLLKIISKLKNNKNIKLLILAGGDFTRYEQLVHKFQIEDQIIVKRDILDIENYITAADVGLYTSEEESFGMGILETMSYGKPVLATDVGGIGEFMQSGRTGFLFRVGKTDEFARKLLYLSKDPKRVKKMGKAASLLVRTDFSGKKIVKQYLEYYKKVAHC
jgi:N-acetyl-alpha-D-glucosaminyl L-malate synthase BshA